MALNGSSSSLLLSDDYSGKMHGCGCWSEEASPLSSYGVNPLWWGELEPQPEKAAEESDVVALLPCDPFEMNLEATSASTTTVITNCIEDFTARSDDQTFGSGDNDDFIVDLSNFTFTFPPDPWIDGYMGVFEGSCWSGYPSGVGDGNQFSWLPPTLHCSQPSGFAEGPSRSQDAALACCDPVGAAPSGFVENPSNSQDSSLVCYDVVGAASAGFAENPSSSHDAALTCCDAVGSSPGQEENDAHPGMFIALGYLSLRDILSLEMVCKSLRSAVRSEFCPWKCIHIDPLLGEKISDADLLRLTQKCPGVLQCLSLVRCRNITNQGLKAVLQSNPQLTKLGIYENVYITYQGLLDNLRSFNMEASIGLKKLRIANLSHLEEKQYEELLSLLKIDKGLVLHKQEPRIFPPDCFLPDLHDEYTIDIEMCPHCKKYRVVYSCPAEGCNSSGTNTCRGCIVCIVRCLGCGECIRNGFVETFNLDSVCLRCYMDGDTTDYEK